MNSDCEKIKEQIADLVTGILPSIETQKLHQHLDECSSCLDYMHALKNEDTLLTQLFTEIDTDTLKRQERVLQAIDRSYTVKSIKTLSIRNIIMKNPVTKLATAAVVIIAVLIGINHFGMSTTSVLWADVVDRFESVPFFKLTIYLGYDNSAEAKKIEIWKSEDSHVRAYEGNKVIFADFSNGKTNLVAFDRTTGESVNTMGYVSMILGDLCSEGRFSLDTIINSIPSKEGITPVKTADTAASKETVVFEIKHKETPEWISILALRGSKLPIRMSFHDPRNNERGDFLFDYSEKRDTQFFDPQTFTKQ
jgi:hypothetical protein